MNQAADLATRCPECGHIPTMNQCVVFVAIDKRCECGDEWHGENRM